LNHLFAISRQFTQGRVLDVRPYGQGNVHDTYLVTLAGAGEPCFILQRFNTRVFPRPEMVMANLRVCTAEIARRLTAEAQTGNTVRWEAPRPLPARDGRDWFIDPAGSWWRVLSFIAAARTYETIQSLVHAREVGRGLGRFHQLLSDLAPAHLADTLPGFHETPGYLRHYDEVLAGAKPATSPEVAFSLQFVAARRDWTGILEEAKAQGRLALRPIHGDPKVDNVLLDESSGRAVALVDLDTVKPGLVHYDIGDCLRSAGNPLGEETERWEAVRFEPDLAQALLAGYLSPAREFLQPADYDYLYDAVRLLAFELGLRFFTDYLAGNVYFKARHRDHNLSRALVQFRLTESIESQESTLRAIIRDLR
jgi:Ser/Thr protein kinase RdoA (MazF antagonist)